MPLFTTAAMCVVVSVGSNGQVEFEEGIHQLWPACRIDIWDGTLVGSRSKLRRAIPQYAHFHPENFRPTSYGVLGMKWVLRIHGVKALARDTHTHGVTPQTGHH